MLEKFRSYLLLISFIVIAGGLMAYIYVLSKGDDALGDKDGTLQPKAFETLTYQVDDSGYLLCDADLCTAAESDKSAEQFSVDAGRLGQIIADYADQMPTVRLHNYDFRINQFDFLERMPGQVYPTVVSLRVIKGDGYNSRLALYSYKPVGSSTSADHQETAERWITQLHNMAGDQ